jgi:hypothetical protein
MSWLPMFLHLMALGTAGATAFVPSKEIGKYYFKFHATLVLVTVVTALLLGKPWAALSAGPPLARVASFLAMVFAAAVLVENVVVRAVVTTLRKDALLFPVSLGVTFTALSAFGAREGQPGQALLLSLHFLTCAAVLGTALAAMSTGHWYLSNAKLPFEILIGLTKAFVLSLVAKAAVSAVYVATRFADYRRLEDFDLMVMGTRLLAGILMAGILGLMALSCAKRRANQSATGILYVVVVFVLIGETMSIALTLGAHPRPI